MATVMKFQVDDFGVTPDIACLWKTISMQEFDATVVDINVNVSEHGVVDFIFDDDYSANDGATLVAVVAGHQLVVAKHRKIGAIDRRTEELIGMGFIYGGVACSLSIPSQSKMTAAHQIKDHPYFAYPVEWNSIDDSSTYSIASAADMDMFYLTAIGTIRARLDSGTSLKNLVRAAALVAEVEGIVDPR